MTTILSTKKSYIDPKHLPRVEREQLGRILSYLRPYRAHALLVLLVVCVSAGLNLLPPLFLKAIVDHLERVIHGEVRGGVGYVSLLCGGMILGPLVAAILGGSQRYVATLIGERVMLDLRQQLYEHVNRQSLRYLMQARPGELVSSVLNDVQGVGAVVSATLVSIVENVIILASTIGLIVYLDWRLSVVAIALLPVFVWPSRRAGLRRKELRRAAQARLAEMTGILAETLSVSGAYLMRVFGAERFEAERLRKKGEELIELSLKQTLVARTFQVLTGLFETVGPAAILGVGSYYVISGRSHDLGSLMAFVAALKRLYSPAAGLAGVHLELLTSYAYFERVFRVLDADPLVKDAPDAIVLPRALGRIEFENVAFTFDDAEEHALRDISLVVEPGECVALVGPSGAGKSTLARLVPRLADPTSGRVLLDDHDLRRLELRSLRSHIAVVTQETYLFHASVQDNLRYARPDASLAQIEAACQAAQIHTLIAGLPEGYETLVGERGYRMSGGERQRLAIARALLKNPRILILDEATSNLDAVNEALVQSALEVLLRGRTSLVIAHRLTTVRGADRIVVLENGRITETGRFDALVAQGGLFSRLHQAASLHLEAP